MNSILEVKNLKKSMGSFSLKNVSFSLEGGFIMGFIGENGAGKTTTLKTLMNIIVKDGGTVKVFGLDNVDEEKKVKDRIGYVSDEKIFFEDISIKAMKNIIAPFYSKWEDKLFYDYVERFCLPLDKKIRTLSQGMYKKFAIAMALSHRPEFLVLDEPSSNLDPLFRAEFLDILREFVTDEQHAVLFSTHITSDLDKIADYVTFIHDGSILFSESKEEMLENCMIIKGGIQYYEIFRQKGLIGVQKNTYGAEGLCKDNKTAEDLRLQGCVLERPTIEDIMMYTVREGRK